jgi:hypothetical protein
MALEREHCILSGHAATIIGDANQTAPRLSHLHLDPSRAGVERVLDQLFHHRGGPLDHLAGGYLAGGRLIQNDYAHTRWFRRGRGRALPGLGVEARILGLRYLSRPFRHRKATVVV